MQWEIRGTRRGKPGQWKLEASTPESARAKAIAAGVTIDQVKPISMPAPVAATVPAAQTPPAPVLAQATAPFHHQTEPEQETRDEAIDQAVAVADDGQEQESESGWTHLTTTATAPSMPPMSVAYATPQTTRAPAYSAIVTGATVLRIFSLFFFLGALLSLVIPVITMLASRSMQAIGLETVLLFLPALLTAAGLVASGLLIRLVAAVSLAIRDIAQNSYG